MKWQNLMKWMEYWNLNTAKGAVRIRVLMQGVTERAWIIDNVFTDGSEWGGPGIKLSRNKNVGHVHLRREKCINRRNSLMAASLVYTEVFGGWERG